MIRKLLISTVILSAIMLLASSYASVFNPTLFWLPSLIGLLYPFLLVTNVIVLIICLIPKKKWWALVPLVAIIATWSSVKTTYSVSLNARNVDEVSIMTWNVKNFDLYNWSNNEETRKFMFQLLEEENPDVLCLQEFYTEDNGKFTNLKAIKKDLGYKHVYFQPNITIDNNRHWGIVTFSKYPIVEKGKIQFDSGTKLNGCIFTDIEVGGDVLRIYNTHLQSYHLSEEDHEFLKKFSDNTAENIASSKSLLKKLKIGFQNRSKQAIQIDNHKSFSPHKTILVGDFNDTSQSFAYRLLSKGMQDAFSQKGFGFDKTYVNRSPFLRIDFVLLDEAFKVNRFKTIEREYSDHYPVKVVFTK